MRTTNRFLLLALCTAANQTGGWSFLSGTWIHAMKLIRRSGRSTSFKEERAPIFLRRLQLEQRMAKSLQGDLGK
ncbi:hypothetical protein C8R43DRAFT_975847 [Mycena crocata]|nr:hypothetical protein C8R43DRAFT_975847 [Mycena crocata]